MTDQPSEPAYYIEKLSDFRTGLLSDIYKADAGDPFSHFSIILQCLHNDFESRITFFFEEDKEVIRFRFLLITPGKEGAKTPQPPTTDKTKKKKSRAYMQDIESLLFFYVDMY